MPRRRDSSSFHSTGGSRRSSSRTSWTTPSPPCCSRRTRTRSWRRPRRRRRRPVEQRRLGDLEDNGTLERRCPGTTTRCSSSTRRARPARRRAPSSPTRTASGRILGFDLATGVSGEDVVLQVLPRVPLRRLERYGAAPGGRTPGSCSNAVSDASRCLALIAEKLTTMMGVPAIYLFMAQEGLRGGEPTLFLHGAPSSAGRVPESCSRRWHARWGLDRPGLRAHGGSAERALPAARGGDPQARLRR